MFGMGWAELAVCALVGFFVFGPERLPTAARDAAKALTKLRAMAQSVTDELKEQLPEKGSLGLEEFRELRDLRDLHPRRIVRDAFFDNDRAKKPEAPADAPVEVLTTAGGSVVTSALPVARTLSGTPTSISFVPPYDVDAT